MRIGLLALTTGVCLLIAGPALAAAAPTLAQEEQQGEQIAAALKAGEEQCADLSGDEFELIGEYVMGRYLGSEATHAAMNQRMTRMMGEVAERRMHMALGYRYTGCSGGPAVGWVGAMAGMMGGRVTDGNGSGMMGGGEYAERGNYSGTMMGSGWHDGDGLSTLGVVLIALAAAALGAGAATLFTRRRGPRDGASAS